MKVIKNYTDLEQSKKLAEILLLESADMCYRYYSGGMITGYGDCVLAKSFITGKNIIRENDLPCWSLTALLNIMPKDKSIECSISFGYYNGKGEYVEKWLCTFEKEGETTDDYIIETTDGDNPVDACVEMILKLKERKLL